MNDEEIKLWKELAKAAATDLVQIETRYRVAQMTAQTFSIVGTELHAAGHILGTDRVRGASKAGHGSDEVVAVSLLFRIAGQLVSAATDLFSEGRHYAAAALLRQLVEVEYLAWAFDARDQDAERWLRSTVDERREFFAPAKLRQAASGKFRGKDYGYHCEMGGHPTPQAVTLLNADTLITQLLLSDLLGHTGRIWDHLLGWSANQPWAFPIQQRKGAMHAEYTAWKRTDGLVDLPPPP
ncbi:MAG: hypothetical protein ABIR26_04145 [Ramlibacter sp.]